MTAKHNERNEQQLRELFDKTAEVPSGPTLTRLGARTREIPERVQRAPRWMPRWAWAPGFAGLSVAVFTLLATLLPEGEEFSETSSVVTPAMNQPSTALPSKAVSSAANVGSVPEAPRVFAPSEEGSGKAAELLAAMDPEAWDDAVASLGPVWDDEDPLMESGLDPLYAAPANEELDAWLYATARFVNEGKAEQW